MSAIEGFLGLPGHRYKVECLQACWGASLCLLSTLNPDLNAGTNVFMQGSLLSVALPWDSSFVFENRQLLHIGKDAETKKFDSNKSDLPRIELGLVNYLEQIIVDQSLLL